jgi:hypothetical protein
LRVKELKMKAVKSLTAVLIFGILVWGGIYFFLKKEKKGNSDALFETVSPVSSGVSFANNISTNDFLNVLSFEYIYLGGGVGIGDFNADGLQDVFFAGNMVASRLYLNRGNLRFEDITQRCGAQVIGWPFGVSVADVNADGLPDIYISMGGPALETEYEGRLLINQGLSQDSIPQFKEMAAEYGLNKPAIAIQSTYFDYDKDGDLDMYMLTGRGYERSPIIPYPIRKDGTAKNTDRLYRNDYDSSKGHPYFTDVSKEAHILEEGYGLGVSILDINEDGWPDIYVTNDYLSNDLLYINNQNGSFSEKAAEYFNHTSHFGMGNDAGDINNDGLIDIVVLDMLPAKRKDRMQMLGVNTYDKFYYAQRQGYIDQYMRNTLQLNQGQGKFSEIGQLAGMYKTSWSWAPLFADFDNDGYQDLFITNGFGKDVTDLDFVKFRKDISSNTGTNHKRKESDKSVYEALEEQPGIKTHAYMYRNKGDMTFEDVSQKWGFEELLYANGAAYADLDNDGDLDIVTNNIDAPAHIYRNKSNDAERQNANNFLRIELTGPPKNHFAAGSTVKIYYKENKQLRYLSQVRGFESTVEQPLHFGLGKTSIVDSLEIIWPDNKKTVRLNIKATSFIKIGYGDDTLLPAKKDINRPQQLFTSMSPLALGIDYKDKHTDFIDFNYERLIPRKYSENGQGITVGDINDDGLEDFFIGGVFGQTGKIYLQQQNGKFSGKPLSKYSDGCSDAGSLFFDADNDGDLDLYVVSGGNQFTNGHKKYQDRLYKNNGKATFLLDTLALPVMLSSGSCVIASDYDKDGDLDLFIGGGIKPRLYPEPSGSYLLRNDEGRFTDVTEGVAPGLKNAGIITGALWTDVDNDNKPDLLICGEWMPISIYKNDGKRLINKTQQYGLAETNGLWQSLTAGDFDNDGDMDYAAGNWGLNGPYQCSNDKPMSLSYGDFDRNGSLEPIMSYFEDGENFPVVSLDYMVDQAPMLKKKFLRYADYAKATTEDVLKAFNAKSPRTLYCKILASVFLENNGNGKFEIRKLPVEAQMAPLFGMLPIDINGDRNLDLISVGNFYWTDVVVGKYDALKGLTMLGDGHVNFKPLTLLQSGFVVDADARSMVRLQAKNNQTLIIISQVLDSVKMFRLTRDNFTCIYAKPNECYADLYFDNNKKRRKELGYGSGYLSQSSRSVVAIPGAMYAEFYDVNGNKTRSVKFKNKSLALRY